ncbi:hypothetical protein BBJ28_00020858 [Nothophytophthora sp. Chile5]|nr:hypothetical protein BBJ28_00020858 [Nothophytophthora sp. Chile5]
MMPALGGLWGVSGETNTPGRTRPEDLPPTLGGHPEMVRPTYFFFFALVPLLASLLLFERLRHWNMQRSQRQVSRFLLTLGRVLRRKPSLPVISRLSLGELIFLLLLGSSNVGVFYAYWMRRHTKIIAKRLAAGESTELDFNAHLEITALTMGVSSTFNLAFLFLPATRNCAWLELLNISYANGVRYHRWLGAVTVVTAVLHGAGYYWAWIREGKWLALHACFTCDAGAIYGWPLWMKLFGEIGLLCFIIIGITSLPVVRRCRYNLFYYAHHLFVPGLVFSIMHWNNIIIWVAPTLALYVAHRVLSSSNTLHAVQVRECSLLATQDVVKVVLTRSIARGGQYKAGQFVYLNVPAVSKLQWHPFTIASSPRTSSDSLTVLVKGLGDWTQGLVQYADDCKTSNALPTVYMDGFYGASLEMYGEYATVCLVGGGIGVTPLLAILEDMVARLRFGASLSQKVFFIFTFRELSLLEEIHPLLMQIKELDPQERYFRLYLSLSRVPSDELLDQNIDHDRLAGKSRSHCESLQTPRPFVEPLRQRPTSRAVMYLAVFLVLTLAIAELKYGPRIQRYGGTRLWPLQNFAEITLLLFLVGAVAFAFVAVERRSSRKELDKHAEDSVAVQLTPTETAKHYCYQASDAHTLRDLVAEYDVAVGLRPNLPEIMQQALMEHRVDVDSMDLQPVNSAIGVFVSGPGALKRVAENAINDIGACHFDMHEEAFEL